VGALLFTVLIRKELFKFGQPIFLSLREILVDQRKAGFMTPFYSTSKADFCVLKYNIDILRVENLFKTKAR